jgi:hypothetical protein
MNTRATKQIDVLPIWFNELMSRPFNPAAATPLRMVCRGPGDHVFSERPVTPDLMVEHLTEISHVHHLSTGRTRIKMIPLVFRFGVKSVADDLTGLDH